MPFLANEEQIGPLENRATAKKEAYRLCRLHQKLFTNTSSSEVRSVEEACVTVSQLEAHPAACDITPSGHLTTK